jgi:multiple sugar transport system substrate-binding protein
MQKRLKRVADALPEEGVLAKSLNRKQFVAGAGAVGLTAILAACGGDDDSSSESAPPPAEPPAEEPAAPPADEPPAPAPPDAPPEEPAAPPATSDEAPLKDGLGEGKWGGPTGFEGAENYQYEFDSEEGRAMQALRQAVQDGTAPDSIKMQVLGGARGHVDVPNPEGAPSLAQLFEEESGIPIDIAVETTPETNFSDNLQNLSTQNGSFDLVQTASSDIGDLATGGLLLNLDEFVSTYQPSWSDPEFGYEGGQQVVNLFNTFEGSTYTVAFDNDTQPYAYRADLFEDATEKGNFEDQHGRPLRFPVTWEEHAQVAEFFTRPDADTPLFGDVATHAPFWQVVNWQQRFVSSEAPNAFYFNDDGSSNIGTDAGVRAAEEHIKALEWMGPNALTDIWIDQYSAMGAGNAVMGNSFPNITKIMPGNPDLDLNGFGANIATDLTPGRVVDGELIRRPVLFFNIAWGVNGFADAARQEPAYLFLQWAGGARIYTWITANPAGFMDPHHTYSFNDQATVDSYSRGSVNERGEPSGQVLKDIIPFTAPLITHRGAGEYTNTLDIELANALTGQKTAEQAIMDASAEWDKITERLGVAEQAASIAATRGVWPTATQTPPDDVLTA